MFLEWLRSTCLHAFDIWRGGYYPADELSNLGKLVSFLTTEMLPVESEPPRSTRRQKGQEGFGITREGLDEPKVVFATQILLTQVNDEVVFVALLVN